MLFLVLAFNLWMVFGCVEGCGYFGLFVRVGVYCWLDLRLHWSFWGCFYIVFEIYVRDDGIIVLVWELL